MTVGELKKALKDVDENIEVLIPGTEDGYFFSSEFIEIKFASRYAKVNTSPGEEDCSFVDEEQFEKELRSDAIRNLFIESENEAKNGMVIDLDIEFKRLNALRKGGNDKRLEEEMKRLRSRYVEYLIIRGY